MSRTRIRTITILIVTLALLGMNTTTVAASRNLPTGPAGHGNSGTWANVIDRYDYMPARKVSADTVSVIDQAVDLSVVKLMNFVSSLSVGSPDQVTGVFVNDVLAYPVVQQPSGNAGYVSTEDDVVTQFSTSSRFGTVGILAHNFLAGTAFFDLSIDQDVYVVFGNGSTDHYVIRDIRRLQALQPTSPYSTFVDLETNATYTSTDVFYDIYGNSGMLVLQTCIANEGIDSWGRLFVIAEKIDNS